MNKQFKEFKARVPDNFAELMYDYWVEDECEASAIIYCDGAFCDLADTISGTIQTFVPDLGYAESGVDGTLCFEKEDNNTVIPVSILEGV